MENDQRPMPPNLPNRLRNLMLAAFRLITRTTKANPPVEPVATTPRRVVCAYPYVTGASSVRPAPEGEVAPGVWIDPEVYRVELARDP